MMPQDTETPCEKFARYREMVLLAGWAMTEREEMDMKADIHREAAEKGRPCPCGRSFPE
ncbi:MAG: hypothetical protein V2I43_29280 [Parvularcula sp.]|jgi:hypothetical protein|nr:hypothetical protein [Parvularcula sp.]